MSRSRPVFFGERWRGLRRAAAFYIVGFFLVVVAAPHHHLNSLADLLSDGPSDSGVILDVEGLLDPQSGAQINPARLIEDEPCLACFHHDFAATAGYWLDHSETLKPLGEAPACRKPALPAAIPKAAASRSPPSSA